MRAARILLVFCLFSSILSTVTSIKCQICVALGEDCGSLDTKLRDCKENEEVCSTVVVNTTITNTSMILIVKNCSTHKDCIESLFTTTTVDGRFEVARVSCCQTEGCNAEVLQLPDYHEFQPNGLQCPGCYALNENHCKATQSVNCVGKEDQCLTITSTTEAFGNYTEKSSYQGCTTQATCSIPLEWSDTARGQIRYNITTLECRNASSSEPDLQ